jgi:hypothetical protein
LRKKAKTRLLTRAVRNRDCVFRGVYRAATVSETVPDGLFSSPLGCLMNRDKDGIYRPFIEEGRDLRRKVKRAAGAIPTRALMPPLCIRVFYCFFSTMLLPNKNPISATARG